MKIKKIDLNNFMIFNKLDVEFSPNINIISGENSTGKTALIKALYACIKGYGNGASYKNDITKDRTEMELVSKFQGVFRPEKNKIGRLVNRRQGNNNAELNIIFENKGNLSIGFGSRQEKHFEINSNQINELVNTSAVYIPPKEIISASENFVSLYADYHIAFEETYYDLARLLERPLKKGPNTNQQNRVLKEFERILNGKISQKDRNFYLNVKGAGEFEMGLVSEGYRKLSTIMYLISSGSLSSDSILFWDEPETNMNPKMIQPMVDAIIELAKMGVQVFITTHDYFVQQCFDMDNRYRKDPKNSLDYRFISLYKCDEGIKCEFKKELGELEHNSVMEEFDNLYDREQEYMYGC